MTAFAMSGAFWVSYALLWFVVVVFGLLIVLVYRQFGLAFMRPADRVAAQGLDVGSRAPAFSLAGKDGREHRVSFGRKAGADRPTVIVFALPGCDICAGLAELLAALPSDQPHARFVWVDGASPPRPRHAIDIAEGWIFGSVVGDSVHRQWEVSAVPFSFIVAADGRITYKGLVNRREDIEHALTTASDSRVLIPAVRS